MDPGPIQAIISTKNFYAMGPASCKVNLLLHFVSGNNIYWVTYKNIRRACWYITSRNFSCTPNGTNSLTLHARKV
ncbi:hypothetical protein ALQ88_200093 [Pseudomonas savastanoi]|nr:hypothetical protein ALQ88_200093 [Pseudomonas savastanoi]